MTKKIIQIALVLAAIGVIVYAYLNITRDKEIIGNPFELVTARTSLVMEITDMSAMDDYMGFIEAVSLAPNEIAGVSFNPASEWYTFILQLDSLRANNEIWFNALLKGSVLLCSNEQGKGDAWYCVIGIDDQSSGKSDEMMKLWKSEKNARDFKNQKIHDCGDFAWTSLKQCLVIASEGSLIEDVVIQSISNTEKKSVGNFLSAREVPASDIPVHFYATETPDQWLQLDPAWIDNQAVLSGFLFTADNSKHHLSLSSGGSASHIEKVLPANTSYFDNYAYAEFTEGWRLMENHYSGTEKSKFWSQAWKDLGDSCNCDLNASLIDWRSGEWGTAVITLSDSSTAEVAYYSIRDTLNAIDLCKPILDHSPDQADGIFKTKYPQLFERNQPEGILVEHLFVMQHKGYLFAASTPGDLRAVRALNGTLSDYACFKKTSAAINHNSGRFIFRKDFYAMPIPQVLRQMLSGFDCIAMNSELSQNGRILINIALPLSKPGNNKPALNTPAASENDSSSEILQGPWPVINHKTGGQEKVILNKKKELCLIGEDGNTLWKKEINGEILGVVQQIDALNNGKLQLAFTTQSAMCVIDRNGNDVAGFPIISKAPVTSPLLIADYEKNKKYRLIYATGDGSIQNINTTGNTSEGWKNPTLHAVITRALHVKTGNEDHLVFVSATGKIWIYKRNGEMRTESSIALQDYDGNDVQIIAGSSLKECSLRYRNKSGEEKTSAITE